MPSLFLAIEIYQPVSNAVDDMGYGRL